jgi:hypothetical protein
MERWSGEICICCSENLVDYIVSQLPTREVIMFEEKSPSNYLLRPIHFLNRSSKSERHRCKFESKRHFQTPY